jgi:serine/threonine protein kinase
LDSSGNIKLIDFGISKSNITKDTRCFSFCGSPPYMAPEIVKREGHSLPVDYYCVGALLYEIATGSAPFDGES